MFQILIFLDLQIEKQCLDIVIKELNTAINILYLLKAFVKIEIYYYNYNTNSLEMAEFSESTIHIDKLKDIFNNSISSDSSVTFIKKLRAFIFQLNRKQIKNKEILFITNTNASNNEALISYHKLLSILLEEEIARSIHMFLLGVNQPTFQLFKETIQNKLKGSLQPANDVSELQKFFTNVSCSIIHGECLEINPNENSKFSVQYFCSEHKDETIEKGIMCTLCGALYCGVRGKCTVCNTRIAPDLDN